MQFTTSGTFAVLGGDFHAQLHVRAFVLMGQHLADVVQQRPALRECDIETQLGRHDAGQPGHLLRMLQDVLTVTGAPLHPPDELHELGMQSVHASLVRGRLAGLHNGSVDFSPCLVHHLFDPPGMNAAVGHEFFQGEARDFPAHGIEARDHDGVRRIVDDDVHARGQLERANVSPFSTDDPALHLVVGQRHRGRRRLRSVLRRDPLHSERHDLLCLTFGGPARGVANLPDPVGRIGLRGLFHPMNELGLGILGRHPGQLLDPALGLGGQSVEVLVALGLPSLAVVYIGGPGVDVLLALIEDLKLSIEDGLPLLEPLLLALDLRAPIPDLALPGLTDLHQLLAAGEDGRLAERFRLALGVGYESLARVFRRPPRHCQALRLSGSPSPNPQPQRHNHQQARDHNGRNNADD